MNGEVKGPKAIGVHGDSYIYAVFKAIGVINGSTLDTLDSHDRIEAQKTAKEAVSMPRPKGSKNKKTEATMTVEEYGAKIVEAEAEIEELGEKLKAKKAELKELVKLKAQAEAVAAKKKAEEDKAAILEAVEKSGVYAGPIAESARLFSRSAPEK